ncbi:MAG: Do family serine endopeptidase [Rhodocyclaceae bacterium]|nr:Do family serine endopeptidase [Rhodocyclaceae bacterium]
MRRFWLIFAQTVTVGVAALFVVQTLKPEWLDRLPRGVIVKEISEDRPADSVTSFRTAAVKAVPSVVHIFTRQETRQSRSPFLNDPLFRHFFGDRFGHEETQRRSGLGSGVVVTNDGYILTNNHVIEAADEIEVASNDGRKFKATVVGSDPESDLAVLRIPANSKLPAITFSSSDSVRVGDAVLAIGNPFGVGQTVTSGIVSALGRTHLGINTFENFIQTDAAINPGNSGGALVDGYGRLIGINTAIYSQSGGSMGIGFAIPVSLVHDVLAQIIRTGAVTRGWIGVEVQEITPELAEMRRLPVTEGALIAGIVRGSPADKAGIRPGDILLAVAGKKVRDAQIMLDLIAALEPGRSATFRVRREGQEIEIPATIGKRPRPSRE